MQSTKKDANNKRKYVSLDEKIDIFERFAKTGEELNGQTVYEGYPIGQWAISIRASVNRGETTLTQKQKDKLDAMGILKRQVDSIDAKIEALVEWNDKYPKAKMVGTDFKVIEAYSSSKEEYDRLLEEYSQMQRNYDYVRVRKSRGKLTPEQEEKCREGNVRGVFGYPTKTQEFAKKYRMSADMAEEILCSYDSMVEFIEEYFYGGEKNSPIGKKIIKNYVDIDFDTNSEGYDALVRDMCRGSRQLVIYSSKGLNEAISTLHSNDRERVEKIYGLMSGNMKSSSELLKEVGRSSTWLDQRKTEIRRKLWRRSRKIKMFYPNASNFENEETIREEFIRMLVDTGVIFKPAKGYEELPFNIDIETFRNKMVFYEGLEQKESSSEEQKGTLQEGDNNTIENTRLDDFGLSARLYLSLARANIRTVGELVQMTEEKLKKVNGIGEVGLREIVEKLAEHGLSLKAEEPKEVLQEDDPNFENARLDYLGISIRSYNSLVRAGVNTVGKLVQMTEEDVKSIRGVKEVSLEEIVEKLAEHGLTLRSTEETLDNEQAAETPEVEGTIGEDKLSLNDLGLPIRLYNSLVRANIHTVDELVQMTEEQVKNIRAIGSGSLEKIVRKLEEHGLTLRSIEETLDNEEAAETLQVEGTAVEDKSSSKQSEIAKFMKNARKLAKLDERLEQARKENNEVEMQRIKSERDKVSKEIQDYLSK